MEYRGIEFAVRARPGRDEWTWTIYPKGSRAISHEFAGLRDEAISKACKRIDYWLKEDRARVPRGGGES
jgi:hypothetical protein